MRHLTPLTAAALAMALAASSCSNTARQTVSLAGDWSTELGTVALPGTTDEAGIGDTITNLAEDTRLSRKHTFVGQLTYTKEIRVPSSMDGKHVELFIEKTKPTTLWVDGDSIGHQTHLHTPHVYDLTGIAPGKHTIELRIDNSFGHGALHPNIGGSHAVAEATQTNWNGALGEISLRAMPLTHISNLKVYATPIDSTLRHNDNDKGEPMAPTATANVNVEIEIVADDDCRVTIDAKCLPLPSRTVSAICTEATTTQVNLKKGTNTVTIPMTMEDAELWSEFQQPLYEACVTLDSPDGIDSRNARFGIRDFKAVGSQFVVNGLPTFLRGKHDACVFPLTGYAPMDAKEWARIFRIAKDYGINHYRFHSWTPPAAAFEAADEVGIYLQPETPYWGELKPDDASADSKWLNDFLLDEGQRIIREFGNHPSFVMMAMGNELCGDTAVMRHWVETLRSQDPRRLYAAGSNNFLGWMGSLPCEEFFVGCRVGGGWPKQSDSHVRASFSFADADNAGLLNSTRPNTSMTFAAAAAKTNKPVVGHETCQYQIYPDYAEIEKYTGVLEPLNLKNFRAALSANGLDSLATDFHFASGALSLACYKADIEMCLRTPGFGGFQLLDLQDYPGQGGALVGILDPFMDSKGLISPEGFRHFCSEVVPLALMDKLTFSSSEILKATVAIANYSQRAIEGETLTWTIATADGKTVAQGDFKASAPQGNVSNVGEIVADLTALDKPEQLTLTLSTGKATNTYNIWSYPDAVADASTNVIRSEKLTDAIARKVEDGATLLLTPSHKGMEPRTVGGLFIPDYWNYAMFKTISENNGKPVSPGTLGYLIDSQCPLFKNFPTESHSDFQWWDIAMNSRPLILDGTPSNFRPTVMAIDNVNRNHKLGVLFGIRMGKGKVLVSMTDLNAIANSPEGRQYASAVESYAASEEFSPTFEMSAEELKRLLTRDVDAEKIEGVKNISDYKELDN